MSKILKALRDSENALLESPTGTGKTLSFLISTLAWQTSLKNRKELLLPEVHAESHDDRNNNTIIPTIYYCSRTHSQLQQIVDELRNCPPEYTENLKMSILGARAHLCINEKAKQSTGKSLDETCRDMCRTFTCKLARNLIGVTESLTKCGIWDIEDAIASGNKHKGFIRLLLTTSASLL
jgi:regulator of telomere elongation helicase 1